MKIKRKNQTIKEPEDISKLIERYSKDYNSIFVEDFGGDLGVFVYHSMGRKDFRELIESKLISDFAKEEVVCESCTLYPENFDFANCEEAGFPTRYSKMILEHSLLTDQHMIENAIHYCRDKINKELDEQITCVIHEAFPEYPVEEIENWDVAKTAEYMAKSEYILHNLRGVPLTPVQQVPAEKAEDTPKEMSERFKPVKKKEAATPKEKPKENNDGQSQRKGKVFMPKSLEEIQRLCPDIDWTNDSIKTQGISALQNKSYDDRPIADIPLDDSEDGENAIPLALRNRFKVIEETDS